MIYNRVLDTNEFKKIFLPLLNIVVNLDDIRNVVNKITWLYRKKGYITSFAYMLLPYIKNGEGKVGEIRINGHKWVTDFYIKN